MTRYKVSFEVNSNTDAREMRAALNETLQGVEKLDIETVPMPVAPANQVVEPDKAPVREVEAVTQTETFWSIIKIPILIILVTVVLVLILRHL